MSPGIWDYVSNNTGKIYNLYGNAKSVDTDNKNKNKNKKVKVAVDACIQDMN